MYYIEKFVEHAIDLETVQMLSEADLRDLRDGATEPETRNQCPAPHAAYRSVVRYEYDQETKAFKLRLEFELRHHATSASVPFVCGMRHNLKKRRMGDAGRALAALRGAGRMAAWRAHAYGGRGELRLEAARVPPLRAPGQLLVRVHASSLNPLDVAMLDGYGARILNALRALPGEEGAEGVEFPLVAGRDFVGSVARAGPGARLRPGRRVWGVVPPHRAGAHADYVVVEDHWAGPAPAALDDAAAGGALYAALSACAVLRAAGLRGGVSGGGGARVLLLGLGGVGHAALQLLVAAGAQVVVGCARAQAAAARARGAAAALDRHAADYARQLRDLGPYDAVVDCAGLGGEAAAAAARARRYATLTTPLLRLTDARGLPAGAAAAAAALLRQSAAAAPAPGPGCPPHVRWAFFAPNAADIEELRRLAERGQFCVQVERVFPWWEARAAYERAAAGSARGKLLLDFTAPPPPGATTPPPPPPGATTPSGATG